MKLEGTIAVIDLKKLHDILASGDLAIFDTKEQLHIVPDAYKLTGAGIDNDNVSKIVAKLNTVLETLRDLDCKFHDEFDGEFC